ncbi:MAG: DUF1679 domain-containing protein [Salinivirgaceae bacterium]|jgi:hypothetical protein|nr:DUF1679 domain-containing protein [Salinivirgaceae bacterium]
MNQHFKNTTLKATGATQLQEVEVIQNLWSGYGKIVRLQPIGSSIDSIVAKHVRLPDQGKHPRGWNTDKSHKRKIKSYEVEMAWYNKYSQKCDETCRGPKCLAEATQGDEVLMVLEDLDAAGFSGRKTQVSMDDMENCLRWLANFHATFLGEKPEGLWPVGTYWHLDTRPDELEVLEDKALKEAASVIDNRLNSAKYQTFVHGDAKLANFCFGKKGKVAAVDFQYVGGGIGMKDVAYFIGSCLYEDDCDKHEDELLEMYFKALREALKVHSINVDADEIEKEWRELYPLAWTDFHRFLKGWSLGHWKINSYSERLAREVVEELNIEK